MDTVFIECFSNLKDPRIDRTKKHLLLDVIAIAICGVLSGEENWEEIEDFAKENEAGSLNFCYFPMAFPPMIRFHEYFQRWIRKHFRKVA